MCFILDNMGYKWNQSSSTLKQNEVTNKSVFNVITTNLSTSYGISTITQVHPKSILHLFKWYFKSKLLHYHHYDRKSNNNNECDSNSNDDENLLSTDYEISTINSSGKHIVTNINSSEEHAASTLAYRKYQQDNIRSRNSKTRAQCTSKLATKSSSSSTQTATTSPTSSSSSNISHYNHYLVRQSICLYAASSVILALCYLTTPTSASTDAASHPV